ncbi:MAG TPA: DUF1853 family protein [Noviherbaspirillum sp.]|nr:DUF1853 family protein [Noviherbaspirillum sp.]
MRSSAHPAEPGRPPSHQSGFHQRWGHLRDPHVRTLAWLLDAPALLDPDAPEWAGRIASLPTADDATAAWLAALDRAPAPLHAALDMQPFTRLGRYAENLLGYYLREHGHLVAHNLQVRAEKGGTIGEFDFILRADNGALMHWEFATKLYLLETEGAGHVADYFVGPNLADTLGAKIRKIMDHQLALSAHPAAQPVLPEPVAAAQALVKGWLFYHRATPQVAAPAGIAHAHCRGFWCALDEFAGDAASRYAILPRLSWLAPARVPVEEGMDRDTLLRELAQRLSGDAAPVLVAILEPAGGDLLEVDRGFVVPDDWRERARRRLSG